MDERNTLRHEEILELYAAVVSARLTGGRSSLLAGIDSEIVASLKQTEIPGEQILADLDALNGFGILNNGTTPLIYWLKNAAMLAGARREAHIFNRFLAQLGTMTSGSETCVDNVRSGAHLITANNNTPTNGVSLPGRVDPSPRQTFRLTIRATLADVTGSQIQRLLDELQALTGDAELTIKRIRSGSVVFEIDIDVAAAVKLRETFESGNLESIVGWLVLAFEASDAPDMNSAEVELTHAPVSPTVGVADDRSRREKKQKQLASFFHSHAHAMLRFISRMTKSGEEAEDILQETWVQIPA